jgi:hypothetical protein
LLAGRFHGKRGIFLKALQSRLFLDSGQFNTTDGPLHRGCQPYVITLSIQVDASYVDVLYIDDECVTRDKVSSLASEESPSFDSSVDYTQHPKLYPISTTLCNATITRGHLQQKH